MKYFSLLCLLILFQLAAFAQQGYKTDNSSNSKSYTNSHSNEQSGLGKNIISFAPLQVFLTNSDQSKPEAAIQLAFERIFNNELLSVKLPVSITLDNPYVYLTPTIKLYPKRQGTVKYAIGPQFLIGFGKGTYHEYFFDQSTQISTSKTITIDRKQLGFMVNNSLNITLFKSFYVGLDAGLGILYYDNLPGDQYYSSLYNPIFNTNSNLQPAFQFAFAMGYRF